MTHVKTEPCRYRVCVGQISYQCLIFYIIPHIKQLRQKHSVLIPTGLIFQQYPGIICFVFVLHKSVVPHSIHENSFRQKRVPRRMWTSPTTLSRTECHDVFKNMTSNFRNYLYSISKEQKENENKLSTRGLLPRPPKGERGLVFCSVCELAWRLATLATLMKMVQNNQIFWKLHCAAFYLVDWRLPLFVRM